MDVSRMGQGQMIAAVGGILLIVGVFTSWGAGVSAWDAFTIMDIVMLLIGIAAIVFAVLPVSGMTVTLPSSSAMILAALGIAIFGFAFGTELEETSGIGVWLAIVGSLGIAYGAYEAGRRPVVPVTRSTTAGGSGAPPPTSTPAPPPPTTPAV